MDQECDRPFLYIAILETRWLDDPSLDLFALRTLKPELITRNQVLALQRVNAELR